MKTTYLNEFEQMAKRGVAYLPVGTIEWHGNQLPIETDSLVAERICQMVAREIPGYILPPIYLGTDNVKTVDGQELRGMDKHLGKKLNGSLYYIEPRLLKEIIVSLVANLQRQEFSKIVIITGHGGTRQVEVLQEVMSENKNILFINPYDAGVDVDHADHAETSIFWACFPEEEPKSRKIKLSKDDDLTLYYKKKQLDKASLDFGKKYLSAMVEYSKNKAKDFIHGD